MEDAGPERVRQLVLNLNVERKVRNGKVKFLFLHDRGAEYETSGAKGNPQKLIHNHETDFNPPRVWDWKRRKNGKLLLSPDPDDEK